jgi:hypothetical protein
MSSVPVLSSDVFELTIQHKRAQHRSESVTSKPEQSTAVFEDPVWSNVGEEACDICETQFEDDYQLNQVSLKHVR